MSKPLLAILAAVALLSVLPSGPPVVSGPLAPEMSKEGLGLVLEQEVGGRSQYDRWPHPEYEADANSGVTWGIGYDGHQNSVSNILKDWNRLGDRPAQRLSETQPFYGRAAKAPTERVKDITVPWDSAVKVFLEVDLARTDAQCRRAFPGFDDLSLHAKDAIRSLVFNRGASMAGPARVEMRAIRDLVPKRDYRGMAEQCRKMPHLWAGTAIYAGMARRRYAEAQLFLTPD